MNGESIQPAEQQSISRSASKVTLGGLFSLLAGLACQMLIASLFGAGSEMDAYLTALVIPTYLQVVLLTGLSFVFIPAFVEEETRGETEKAWSLAGTFFWITAGTLLVLAAGVALAAREVIGLSAPGFGVEKAALSSRMLTVLMFSVPFYGLASLTAGIQNARGRFFWPATATALGALGNLMVVALFSERAGPMALAWGLLSASVLQAGVTVIPVVRHGWGRTLPLRHPKVLELGRLILPFIVFKLVSNLTSVLERYFASRLPDGELSNLGYAGKISNIFVVLLAASISAAIFPAMARAFASQGRPGLLEKTAYGLRLTLAVALPALALVGVCATPVVRVLFERGAFVETTSMAVSALVLVVMLGDVLFRMLGNMVSQTFYVLKDTLTTPVTQAVTVVLYVILGGWFVRQWGTTGLAWARALQAGLGVVVMTIILLRRVRLPGLGGLARFGLMAAAGSFIAAGSGWLVWQASLSLHPVFQASFSLLAGGMLYLLILYFVDTQILWALLDMAGVSRLLGLASRWQARRLPRSERIRQRRTAGRAHLR